MIQEVKLAPKLNEGQVGARSIGRVGCAQRIVDDPAPRATKFWPASSS